MDPIEQAIAQVLRAYTDATAVLEGRWFADQEKQRLRALRSGIDGWASRGRALSRSDQAALTAWKNAGNVHLAAIAEVLAQPSGTLADIRATVAEAPRVTGDAVVRGAQAAGRAARTIAIETSAVAGKAIGNMLSGLWPVLLIAGAAGVAYVVITRRK